MTDDQAKVFGALARGRLIFPFHDERQALHAAVNEGGLTAREQDRKAVLDDTFSSFESLDRDFHTAVVAGNLDVAHGVVLTALDVASAAIEDDDA